MSGFGSNSGKGGSKLTFNGDRPVTRSGIPGVNAGGTTLLEWVEKYFFPAVPPGASLSGGTTRQFGASPTLTLSWNAVRNTNPIDQIIVAGESIAPTGNSQSGTKAVVATQNVNTTWGMSVKAGADTVTANQTLAWSHRRFWGKLSRPGISPVQADGITANPAFTISDAEIIALTGAGIGTGSEFASSRVKNYNGINGAGDYLVFAFPSAWGTPQFVVGNLPNTAFTKIRDNAFINSDGYSAPFQVWVSNTIQNSAIALFQIN